VWQQRIREPARAGICVGRADRLRLGTGQSHLGIRLALSVKILKLKSVEVRLRREHDEEHGVAVRGRVREQPVAAAVGAARVREGGRQRLGPGVRAAVAGLAHQVGRDGAVAGADQVQHGRVPAVAAAAESACGRQQPGVPARSDPRDLPEVHLLEPAGVQAVRLVVGRRRPESSCVLRGRLFPLHV